MAFTTAPHRVAFGRPAARVPSQVACRAEGLCQSRRALFGALVAIPAVFWSNESGARDLRKAAEEREQQRLALKEAAEEMKRTGVTTSAFADSSYAVSEMHTTPNSHTRQGMEHGVDRSDRMRDAEGGA